MKEFLRMYGLLVLVAATGLGIVGYGVWQMVAPEQATVEIQGATANVPSDQYANGNQEGKGSIVVDVAGSVVKPGVYSLSTTSRIGDALVVAGGLAATADRSWVAENMNLAELVKDGEKIFIPSKADENNNQSPSSNTQTNSNIPTSNDKININTATEAELDGLWGIGEARATAIIAARPYSNIDELVSKAKVPQNVYDKIKDQVSVY